MALVCCLNLEYIPIFSEIMIAHFLSPRKSAPSEMYYCAVLRFQNKPMVDIPVLSKEENRGLTRITEAIENGGGGLEV